MDSVKKKVISAGGVLFWRNNNNILICIVKRKGRNVWVLPRGRVEENENMEETVIREVREETGISPKIIRKIGVINYTYYSPYEKVVYNKEVHFYLLKIYKQFKFVPNSEIQDMKWVSIHDAIKMLSYDKEKEIVLKAVKYITK